MKVIIPVAGVGTRLRPHTNTQPKALVPVAGKAIISHIVDNLVAAGMKEFIFIVSFLGDKIESYIRSRYKNIRCEFILQTPRIGSGHAVWLAKDFIGDSDELVIALGDTIFDIDAKKFLGSKHSALGVKKVDDPRHFGVAEVNDDGVITKLAEKPPIPKSNLALVGLYKIKEAKQLMLALDENIKNNFKTHDEFQLTDGIMKLVSNGVIINAFTVEDWFDCGSKENLLDTNAVMLSKAEALKKKKYSFENSVVIPPVSIPDNCNIRNSIIGPNVSVGENTIITDSVLRDAIIGSDSEIKNSVLHHSIIGNDATLKGLSQSLNIGDNTEIDFG
jgi:glucose-1-phosphate thymidylyltransferase